MKQSVYSRPNKPKRAYTDRLERVPERVPDLPSLVEVDTATECHVTPADVAARMVDYLGAVQGVVLEPSAGTGNLLNALRGEQIGRIVESLFKGLA